MIHRIKIKGYKSLDVDVELSPEVTVLVGRSGSGKSNFVEALRFLRDVLRDPTIIPNLNNNPEKRAEIEALPKSGNGFSLEFCVEYTVPTFSERICYAFTLKDEVVPQYPKMICVSSESLKVGEDVYFSREKTGWTVPPKIQGIPDKLVRDELVLPLLHGIREVSFAFIALAELLGIYYFPFDIGRNKPQRQSLKNDLADDGSNFRVVLDKIRADMSRATAWDDINESLRHLNPSITSVDMTALRGGDMLVTHKFGDTFVPFPVEQESEGCRRFLVHLLALYQTPPKLTLVFEEPENGIHPGALHLLADEFINAPAKKSGQVILTTHNPYLLDFFSPKSIRLVEMEKFRTNISPLNTEQLRAIQEDLINPGEYLMFSGYYLKSAPEEG